MLHQIRAGLPFIFQAYLAAFFIGVVVLTVPVTGVAAQAATARSDATQTTLPLVPYNEQHPILAYYYAWWEPERLAAGLYQPVLMPAPGAGQISDDLDLERAHISQARSAGSTVSSSTARLTWRRCLISYVGQISA
ncbi:MAG: hypothetical protein JOZ87_18495 [Chloroflexi bacterium]|nr:hypothetical protein [Chloroflexota bacterium]